MRDKRSSDQWRPGWPDLAIFHQFCNFWKLIVIFRKEEVTQVKDAILGYFLLKQIF